MTLRASVILTANAAQFKTELGQAGAAMRELGGEARSAGNTVSTSLGQGVAQGIQSIRQKVTGFAGAIRGSFSVAKNSVQQLGFQLQDVAVGLAGGQNPFTVLAQQGSQIAGIFGPGGAVVGAVIAGVGLIGRAFFEAGDGMSAAERAAGSFKTAMDGVNDIVGKGVVEADKLIKSYDGLSTTMRRLEALRLAKETREATTALRDQGRALEDLLAQVEKAGRPGISAIAERTGVARGGFDPGQLGQLRAAIAEFSAGTIDEVALVERLDAIAGDASGALRQLVDDAIASARAAAELRQQLDELGAARTSLEQLAAGGNASLSQLEEGLQAIQDAVAGTTQSFAQMYQDVVGGSYIPDMVEESSGWFDKLKADLTGKTKDATGEVANAFRGLTRQVSGELSSMIVHNKLALSDFASFAQSTLQTVLQGLIQIGLNAGFSYAFAPSGGGTISGGGGGALSGSVGADTLHGGGIAGAPGNRKTRAPLGLFASARRYHAGGPVLRAGEVPAILQAGEQVIPAGGRGGGVTVNVIDQRSGGEKVETRQRRGAGGEPVVDVVIRDKVNGGVLNGAFDTAMRTRYGLSPITGTR